LSRFELYTPIFTGLSLRGHVELTTYDADESASEFSDSSIDEGADVETEDELGIDDDVSSGCDVALALALGY